MSNQATIAAIYSAFEQGDVPFILATVAENFNWTDPSDRNITGQGGTWHGRTDFGEFFGQLVAHTDTTLWEVNDYTSEGNTVVTTGKHGISHKKTGKAYIVDWVMIWHFADGQLVSGRCFYDTARFEAIYT